jgi:uncharacterized protein
MKPASALSHSAPAWLPGGHLQTIWPALFARAHRPGRLPQYRRERWATPDGDFVDVDFLQRDTHTPGKGLLVLFHGLEGSSQSHYARAFADWADEQELEFVVPHFRGCSGELNRAPRAYHSGDHEEIDWMLARLASHACRPAAQPVMAVGVSLGGNALMRWAGERAQAARQRVAAVAAVCAPLDLTAGGHAMGQGLNRRIYTPMFLRSMKPKALAKWRQHPGLFDAERLRQARDLYGFDDVFTAPLHGFSNTDDYWRRASAKPWLRKVAVPALLLNPLNDPVVPAASLPRTEDVSPQVTLWQPRHGGHVGFAEGPFPGDVRALPRSVGPWLLRAANGGPIEPSASEPSASHG